MEDFGGVGGGSPLTVTPHPHPLKTRNSTEWNETLVLMYVRDRSLGFSQGQTNLISLFSTNCMLNISYLPIRFTFTFVFRFLHTTNGRCLNLNRMILLADVNSWMLGMLITFCVHVLVPLSVNIRASKLAQLLENIKVYKNMSGLMAWQTLVSQPVP
jgi:hypothetical protein